MRSFASLLRYLEVRQCKTTSVLLLYQLRYQLGLEIGRKVALREYEKTYFLKPVTSRERYMWLLTESLRVSQGLLHDFCRLCMSCRDLSRWLRALLVRIYIELRGVFCADVLCILHLYSCVENIRFILGLLFHHRAQCQRVSPSILLLYLGFCPEVRKFLFKKPFSSSNFCFVYRKVFIHLCSVNVEGLKLKETMNPRARMPRGSDGVLLRKMLGQTGQKREMSWSPPREY